MITLISRRRRLNFFSISCMLVAFALAAQAPISAAAQVPASTDQPSEATAAPMPSPCALPGGAQSEQDLYQDKPALIQVGTCYARHALWDDVGRIISLVGRESGMFFGPISPWAGDELKLQVQYDRARGNTRGLDFDVHGLAVLYPNDPSIRHQAADFENGEHRNTEASLGNGVHQPPLTVKVALEPINGRSLYEEKTRSLPTSVRAVCMDHVVTGSDDDRDRARNGPFLMGYVVLDASTRTDWVRRIYAASSSATLPAHASFKLIDQVNYSCTLPGMKPADAESTLMGGRMWRIRIESGSLRGTEMLWMPSPTSIFDDGGPQCFSQTSNGACPLVKDND